jgi:hypothetical protein
MLENPTLAKMIADRFDLAHFPPVLASPLVSELRPHGPGPPARPEEAT